MVTLEVRVDVARPLALLRAAARRMAYAVVNTLNDAAKAVQKNVREDVAARLTLRKREFILRQAAVIDPFASVPAQRFHARVAIGTKDRLLLPMLETGGTRPSFGGGERVAVPLTGGPARPTFAAQVPASLRVTRLRLVKVQAGQPLRRKGRKSARETKDVDFRVHQTASGKRQIKGAHRTFVLFATARAPEGGIYQRVGSGRDDIRLIYPFVRQPSLERVTRWIKTARRTAAAELPRRLQHHTRAELARAFGVGR